MSIERIISDNLNLKESDITDNKKFIEDLNADSLSIVEILMSIEEEFDIEIPDEDTETISTVGEMKQYIVDNSSL